MRKELNKKTLKRMYLKEGKSLATIARLLSCSPPTVRSRCVDYGIPIREPKSVKGTDKALRTVFLDKKQLDKLDRLTALTRVPTAAYIREAVDLVLYKYELKLCKKLKK